MSLRGRTDDDDRFCRRSLLLFLIFLWWPYVPPLYHFLSLVILVSYTSLLFLYLSFSLLLLLDFLLHPECKPLPGRCSRNCLQGDGIEKKDDLVPRQTKEIRESKWRSKNDYLATLMQNNVKRFVLRGFIFTYLSSSDNRGKIIYFEMRSDNFPS